MNAESYEDVLAHRKAYWGPPWPLAQELLKTEEDPEYRALKRRFDALLASVLNSRYGFVPDTFKSSDALKEHL